MKQSGTRTKRNVLAKDFFARQTTRVAEELLGKFLVRRRQGKEYACMITEVEVYDGFHDTASHASRGETARTRVMFGYPGVWYVYLIYGMYDMLNIVTREKGYPAAILIRRVEGASGPGKLTKLLHVTKSMNNKHANKRSGLWIEDRGIAIKKKNIMRTPRIGVDFAGARWARAPLRFFINETPSLGIKIPSSKR